ncbi:RNA 2',3'-cyclic phosphodiesterase [Nitrospira moscoviensis]|uniref:RNA 2',3'-cyclic phosphodiesterase n=1 Tax=Nitrospira moscoviensis TaxID=42253 RepID=A0A0K2GEC6_NITMO|nr:RNA 2',3'-cyclic phosphodiesterase [Nitrospira moscoviensis]ALA58937.1 putative 2'-5' RNA ligase [Nitrospira moscoviensis]
MIRAFLAVELTEELRARLGAIQRELKQQLTRDLPKGARLSWVQPASIHLTVRFLGETEERLIEPLRAALEPIVAQSLPISLPLERLGIFPRVEQPRVLWAGPSAEWEQGEDAGRLAEFHRKVEDCCRSFGFEPEGRPWSPHFTLARIKAGERQVGQAIAASGILDQPMALGILAVTSLVLMKSELRPTGSVYTKLWGVQRESED